MVKRAGIGADWLDLGRVLHDRIAGREKTGFGFRCGNRARAGGGTAQAAPVGMTEASARRLDVSAGPLAARRVPVERQGVHAR